jgi:FkbM family methyltransferase
MQCIPRDPLLLFGGMRKLLWEIASRTPGFKGKAALFAALSRPGKPAGVVVSRQGVRFRLWGHDLNEWYIATQRLHSEDVSCCIDRVLSGRTEPVLWDVGANIGAVTLPFLLRHPTARAVCFEASAEVAGRLLANIALNPQLARRCSVVLLPLMEREAPAEFFVSSETFNSGVGGLGVSRNRSGSPVRTYGITGDAALSAWNLPAPDLIKLDVEGFELEVLKGLSGVLARSKPSVIFEHSMYRFRERGIASNDVVVAHLRGCGYEICHLDATRKLEPADLTRDCDLLALPG